MALGIDSAVGIPYFPEPLLITRGGNHCQRIYLSFQRITEFIENKIHAPIGMLRFLVKAAVGLLFLAVGRTN